MLTFLPQLLFWRPRDDSLPCQVGPVLKQFFPPAPPLLVTSEIPNSEFHPPFSCLCPGPEQPKELRHQESSKAEGRVFSSSCLDPHISPAFDCSQTEALPSYRFTYHLLPNFPLFFPSKSYLSLPSHLPLPPNLLGFYSTEIVIM